MNNTHDHAPMGLVAFVFIWALLVTAALLAFAATDDGPIDQYSQSNFPCMEDEALKFVVSASNDRTGCVHLDDLRGWPFAPYVFPCYRDEALVYAPQFGPDRFGCMHIAGGSIAPEVWERDIR